MATLYSPKIVTDGMVLYLDAANYRSYPGTGITWNDLSGNNNNGTLTNGPTFSNTNGGSIVFDGTNDYVNFSLVNFGNELTVMCFVNPQSSARINTIFGNSAGGSNTNGVRLYFNTFNTNDRLIVAEVGNGSSGYAITTAGNSTRMVYGSWQHITYVLNKTTSKIKIYYNGSLTIDVTPTVNNYNTNAVFRLGTLVDALVGNYALQGNVANYSIYSRELSSQEVLQNFNVTRSRFGV